MAKAPRKTQIPPYAAETEREIKALGPGGNGNFESNEDAAERGITPELVEQTRLRLHAQTAAPPEDMENRIREKAYELWLLEGRPEDGQAARHWEMARNLIDIESRKRD